MPQPAGAPGSTAVSGDVTGPARALEVQSISKRYDVDPVLSDVSIEVADREIVALLGPSGCGKTTLLRTIAGLERADAGTITIGGTLMSGPNTFVAPEKRRIGMVFQNWALFPHLTVRENVAYGLPRSERKSAAADDILDVVGLAGFGHRDPATLSGGQQQRVALARALAPRPSVLLLDEPFSNLDSALRMEVRSEVHRLLRELGVTTVFVTHDQEEAFVLGDRVAVMHGGIIEQVDPPRVLYSRPATRWIASFVGNVNLVRFDVGQTPIDEIASPVGAIGLNEPTAGAVDVLLRPEDFHLTEGDAATVELVEYYGHDVMVSLSIADDGGSPFTLWVRTPPGLALTRGDQVGVTYSGGPTVAFAPESG